MGKEEVKLSLVVIDVIYVEVIKYLHKARMNKFFKVTGCIANIQKSHVFVF